MIIKKIIAVILTAVLCLGASCIDTFAAQNEQVNIYNLSDYEYYSTFAKALQKHDYELVAQYITCSDPKQFDYNGVTIKDYSVEIIPGSNDGNYRPAAYITLNVTKSNKDFFKKGKTRYYAYIDKWYGAYGVFSFYPVQKSTKTINKKYYDGVTLSVGVASYLTNFKSASLKQIKNMDYSGGFIHFYYHFFLIDKHPNGIKKADLTKAINKFYGSEKKISQSELINYDENEDMYFKNCGHGMPGFIYNCQKITKNKKTGYYTYDIWFYSDAAAMNVCRKMKFTYSVKNGNYTLKNVNCYYSTKYNATSI